MHKKAFSLIEVLISLIIISLIVVAFAPIVTKKLTKGKTSIVSKITTNCSDVDAECKLCSTISGSKKCIICDKNCGASSTLDKISCKCIACSILQPKCVECNEDKCIKCQLGYALEANGTCSMAPCNPGQYSDGTKPCEYCPAGTYNMSAGRYNCDDCPKGYYCTGGNSKVYCAAGSYGQEYRSKSSADCKTCPSGYYCIGGSSIQSCGTGKKSAAGSKNFSDCILCPAGSYQPYNEGKVCYSCNGAGVSSEGAAKCTPCPNGKMVNSNYTACIDCPLNHYCNGITAIVCPEGYTCTNGIKSDLPCQNGTYVLNNKCETCPAGYSCKNGIKTKCAQDKYAPSGSSYCFDCNNGFVSDDKSSCIDCNSFGGGTCKKCDKDGCLDCGNSSFIAKAPIYNGKYGCASGDDACKDKFGTNFIFVKTGQENGYDKSRYAGYCVSPKNIPDIFPSLVSNYITDAGGAGISDLNYTPTTSPRCWRAVVDGNNVTMPTGTSSSCSIQNYNCTRTVCNAYAANDICHMVYGNSNMRLMPLNTTIANAIINQKLAPALGFCEHSACKHSDKCYLAGFNKRETGKAHLCRPSLIWVIDNMGTASAYKTSFLKYENNTLTLQDTNSNFDSGLWSLRNTFAASVRCAASEQILSNTRY